MLLSRKVGAWLLGLMVFGVLLAVQPAQARVIQPPNPPIVIPPAACALPAGTALYPNHWLAVWNFDDARGCVLYTGVNADVDLPPPIIGYDLIECRPAGNLDVRQGELWLDGESYLECPFAIDHPRENPTALYDHFGIQAQLTVEGKGDNPVFVHPNLTFATPARWPDSARMAWSFTHEDQTRSNYHVTWQTGRNDLLNVAVCPADEQACARRSATFLHTASINGTAYDPFRAASMIQFDLKPTTVYIGYDPATRAMFNGRINQLIIDPVFGKDPSPDSDEPMPTPTRH